MRNFLSENYQSYEFCEAEMPKCFLFGTLRGSLIDNLKMIIEDVSILISVRDKSIIFVFIRRYICQQ